MHEITAGVVCRKVFPKATGILEICMYLITEIKVHSSWICLCFSTTFARGDNFCNILFASL